MTKALNATGRPILYSMCNWGMDTAWSFAPTIANSWRITGDLTNVFDREDENCPCSELGGLDCKQAGAHCSIMNTVNKAVYFPSRAFKGAWNDLDLLRMSSLPYVICFSPFALHSLYVPSYHRSRNPQTNTLKKLETVV